VFYENHHNMYALALLLPRNQSLFKMVAQTSAANECKQSPIHPELVGKRVKNSMLLSRIVVTMQ